MLQNFLSLTLAILLCSCDTFKFEKTITQGMINFPVGLDPARNYELNEIQIYGQIYETLLTLDKDLKTIRPHLATHWDVSEDFRCYVFYLRPNVNFHDNTVFTAHTAQYAFERQIKLKQSFPLFDNIAAIKALDPLTLEIKLKVPHSIFLYALASPIGLVAISQQALQKYGDDIAYHPVGSGPFQFSEWIENEKIVLTSYPNYWQQKNLIDNLCFKFYHNNYKREQSIEEDDVDILYAISGYNVDRLKWLGTIDFYIQQPVSILYIGFNNKSFPFNSLNIRKAIQKAINIPKFVYNINRGNADIALGPIPGSLLEYGNLKQDKYNISQAKELLNKAGYSKGLQANFFFPTILFSRYTIIELLKAELAKINISFNVTKFNSWEEYGQAIISDSSQMFIDAYGVEVLGDPWNFLFALFHSGSKNNRLNYENPLVDSLLNQCAREFDSERRSELYRKIMIKILHDVPAVFLYHVKSHFAYNKNKIKRLIVNPYEIIQYHRLILNE